MSLFMVSCNTLRHLVLFAGLCNLTCVSAVNFRQIVGKSASSKPASFLQRTFEPSHALLSTEGTRAGAEIGTWGFDESGQDISVGAGENFFKHANGKFVESLEIPADKSRWGWFDILANRSLEQVRSLLEEDAKVAGKAGKFYSAFMNEDLVEELDLAPLQSSLQQIKAFRNKTEFAALVGTCFFGLQPSPINLHISPDEHDPDSYAVTIDQAGLGLPNRDYYLDKSFAEKKAAYSKYIADMLHLIGWPSPDDSAKQVLELENSIANVSWSLAARRDPVKTYNLMSGVSALKAKAPGFDWDAFLEAAAAGRSGGLPGSAKLIVGALSGVVGIAKILEDSDLEVLRSWTAFHLVSGSAAYLPKRFVDTSFNFSKALSGQQELSPRWKRAVSSVNGHMGEAVGKVYADLYFPETSKVKVEGLTQELKRAFKSRIEKLDWMSSATKKTALTKLESFDIQVGYPKKFETYDTLKISEKDLLGNIVRSVEFDWFDILGKMDKPVDRDEWAMNVQEVNAYNMPVFNQVVFPAAILQPPFFDPNADMAVNYGGIGGVIGHEMTHGFDDQGRQYNARGQLHNWWTEADEKEFNKRAQSYGRQFASFDLGVDNASINPNLTMGENIADLGGLTIALEAFRSACASGNLDGKSASGPEGDRRVFLGWAQVWRSRQRDDALLNQLVADPHSPVAARVNIPTRNLDAWYSSFNVTQGDKNYLAEADRVAIW
mmetsp:Transcript_3717/g.6638  ORF Transcript_3717/g.6638 Transcript_3717/m.6638 type:complete len:719 (-) Transcript_3717:143-2299(-)